MRVFFIIFFASVIIATFKPKAKTQQPLATTSELPAKPKPTRAALAQEMLFDLFLMRLSFIVDIFSHTFVTLFPAPETKIHALSMQGSSYSQIMFVAASSLSSFGSGVVPAVQSLALCVLQSRSLANASAGGTEKDIGIGRLFGALAVVQAVGQMIIGPTIFGLVYGTTVATFPKAIFTTAAGLCLVSLALVCMVRPDGGAKGKRRRAREEVEIERGRSRASKDLRVRVPERSEGSETSGNDGSL